MKYKFNTISMHPYTACNMNPPCPFCYKKKCAPQQEKPEQFWLDLVKPIAKSKLAPQLACGGGEPFMKPDFIKKLGKECKSNKLILNVTTNGKLLMYKTDNELKELLKDITMISISVDSFKVPDKKAYLDIKDLIVRIKSLTKCEVGINFLVEAKIKDLISQVNELFNFLKADRVFALCPKNIPQSILKHAPELEILGLKYEHFYVDDLTKKLLEEGMPPWKTPCHFGKDIVSINEKGEVTGCSFCSKPLLTINAPEDILKIGKIKPSPRYSCPYLK